MVIKTVCVRLAGIDSFAELPGAELLLTEDVAFLQSISDCSGMSSKRHAAELVVCDDQKLVKAARVERPEELLSRKSTSDLDIKDCGPRAAGKLLLGALNSSCDRRACTWHPCGCTHMYVHVAFSGLACLKMPDYRRLLEAVQNRMKVRRVVCGSGAGLQFLCWECGATYFRPN